MLTSRRDYILRILDEVGLLLSRVLSKRVDGSHAEALQTVVTACERLFQMEAARLFQFTPDQHFLMLAEGEPPEIARDKVLLYAALSAEAGRCYRALGNAPLARQSLINALRLAAKARQSYAAAGWPAFAPNVDELLGALDGAPLDADTAKLLAAVEMPPYPPPKSSP